MNRPLWLNLFGLLTLCLFGIGAYLGLVYSPADINQGDLIRIMYAHVSAAWVCFVAVILMAVFGALFLWRGKKMDDIMALASAEMTLLFSGLTLIGGMTYSKPTLGVYWDWDFKLTLTALMFFLVVGYFIVRAMIDDPLRKGRVSAIISIIILASLPFNWLATKLFRTIHPNKSSSGTMDPTFAWILLFNVAVVALIYIYFMFERVRLARLEAKLEEEPISNLPGEAIHV